MRKWSRVTEITNNRVAAGGVWNRNRTLPDYGTGRGEIKYILKEEKR